MAAAEGDDAPPAFCCPISFEVMTDPVFLVAVWPPLPCTARPVVLAEAPPDERATSTSPVSSPLTQTGHTFERASIEAHLAKSSRCPLSGVDVTDRTLMPNHALRNAIEDYLSERSAPSAPPAPAARTAAPTRPPPPPPHASRVPAAVGAAAASADGTGYLKASLTGVASKLAPAVAAAAGAAAAQAGRLAAAAASTATQRQMPARSTAAHDQAPAPAAESQGAPAPATTRRPSVAASILGGVRAGMIMAAEKLEAYADSANAQSGATNLPPAARPASAGAQPSAAAAGAARASMPALAPQLMPLERMDTDAQIAAAIQLSLQDMGRACGDGQPGRGTCRVCRGGPVNNFCTQCGAPAR